MDNTIKNILIIFLLILIFYLMSVLSALLIPLVLALLFSALFQPLIIKLTKLKAPNWLIIPCIMILTLGIFYGMYNIIINAVTQIADQQDFLLSRLQIRLDHLIAWMHSSEGMTIISDKLIEGINGLANADFLSSAAGGIAAWVAAFTGSFLMFAVYYIILLSGMTNLENYLTFIDNKKEGNIKDYYKKIHSSVFEYMMIKGVISISTGTIVSIICIIFGIKFAIFWGFLIFILNFIPSIGSVIATIPPVLMSFIQYDSIETTIFLLLCLIGTQFTIGNLIEPKIMGNRLKLNTITVIFGLVFWGYIWGIPGMLLSVPLMVIIKLIFEQSASLSIIARIMGSPEKIIKEKS